MTKKEANLDKLAVRAPDVIMISIDEISPYKNNPRKISKDAVSAVEASLKQFGWQQPLVVYGPNNEIVVGHTRYEAAKKLGLAEVPCFKPTNLSPKDIKAYRIIDNKTNSKSVWDFDKLNMEMDDLDIQSPVFALNFSPVELDTIMNFNVNEAPKEPGAPRAPKRTKGAKSILVGSEEFEAFVAAATHLREFEPELTDGECLAKICSEWINFSR